MARPSRLLPVLACALALSACAQVRSHWPFRAHELPAPVAVHELTVVVAPDAAMPIVLQYWERNTLVVDLQGVAASGALTLRPAEGRTWPVRLAFRASPGRFEVLEVRGSQRVLLPVSGDRGAAVVTMPLAPSVHAGVIPQLALRWGPADSF
jgi:hypothetical protein